MLENIRQGLNCPAIIALGWQRSNNPQVGLGKERPSGSRVSCCGENMETVLWRIFGVPTVPAIATLYLLSLFAKTTNNICL